MATGGVVLQFNFLFGLRGYHQYKLLWTPVLDEILATTPEIGSCFDRYAIAAYQQFGATEQIVSHLPREYLGTCTLLYFMVPILCVK